MTLPLDAAARKAIPITTGFCDYFPDAMVEVAILSRIGNDQHNPGQPLHWAKDKSTDHANCIVRHLLERGTIDTDGVRHSAKVAWRAMALLQIEIEKSRGMRGSPQIPAAGQIVPVHPKPGESMSEAVCRTAREAHGLPRMQEQGREPPSMMFGFTIGETVNLRGVPKGDNPGVVIDFSESCIDIRWNNQNVVSGGWRPTELRHGE